MGGMGSGRRDGRPVVERSLRLDLRRLLAGGQLRPGQHVAGSLTWNCGRSGKVAAAVGYEANMLDPEAAWMRLRYRAIRRGGAETPMDYCVPLATTRPGYGGLRWWFRCPLSGQRARILYLQPRGIMFASRQALGLGYLSQRQTAEDRNIARSHAARRKLGLTDLDTLTMPHCPRPKGMRWSTYQRHVDDIRACHERQLRLAPARWGPLLG